MQEWISTEKIPELTEEENKFRNYLISEYNDIKKTTQKEYEIDLLFGLSLYKYLASFAEFNMRVATDNGFWRNVSLSIIPDVVADRWGKDNESHYWKRSTRIWPSQIWWYIHLSWQGDEDFKKTKEMLTKPCFTTDEIMNLVERSGKNGAYLDVYREIMLKYSKVSDEERKKHQDKRKTLFRKIMILNTAKQALIDPELFGIDEYVDMLFNDLKVGV